MKTIVTDQAILAKCKELLDAWSASRPYTPTKQLGRDAEFVSAVSHTIERFTLTTGMRTRKFVLKKLSSRSAYNKSPKQIARYDLWGDVVPERKREDFEVGLDDTTYAETCDDCRGQGKTICETCHGHGSYRCTKHHKDFTVNGRYYSHMVSAGLSLSERLSHSTVEYKGDTWYKCKCDPETHIIQCDCDNGYRKCKTCDGVGHLVYEWFVVQKYKETVGVTAWKPSDKLTDDFYSLANLPWVPLYEEEGEDGRYQPKLPLDASDNVSLVMKEVNLVAAWDARRAIVDGEIEKLRKEDAKAEYKTSFEHVVFEQYDGIVECDYKYDGKEYKVWINLATGAVEETENGLYASIAEETVRLAQESEKEGVPQDAIYYYCKADAISLKWGKENGTQKRRVRQYRMLGAWFGGAMLVISLLCWLPALCMSGMDILGIGATICGLFAITACMVSLNELIQVGGLALVLGLSYLAHTQFGTAFGEDLIVREGYLISLLAYAWAVVTLTTDQGQRLPGGRKGLLIGGCLAGLVAAPVALYVGIMSQSFVKTGGLFVPLLILVVFSLIRLPVRLKAGKMQKFVEKNDGNGEKVRKVIESRKPCKMGAIEGSVVIASLLILTLWGLVLGGPLDTMLGNVHFSLLTTLQEWGVL